MEKYEAYARMKKIEMNKLYTQSKVRNSWWHKTKQLMILVLSAMMALSCQSASASNGMLIVSKDNGKTYLLLVQTHKHDHYEFPGGRLEQAENLLDKASKTESPYETALRETVEEMRGFLGRQQLHAASSETNFVEAGKYRIYIAQLPFFSLKEVREIKIPKGKKWSFMREVVNYAWVDAAKINDANDGFVTANDGQAIELGPDVLAVIKQGRSKKWFN